jgi:hypothetical protein
LSAFKRKGSIEDRGFDAEEDGKKVFIPILKADRFSGGEDGGGVSAPVSENRRSGG